jgi:Domain of unknown function (DUF4331)
MQMRSIGRVKASEPRTNEIVDMSRRQVLIRGAIVAAGMSLPLVTSALSVQDETRSRSQSSSNSLLTEGEKMSHHLDSPIARQDVRLDITDLYVFRGQVGTVFVINVCHSIAKPPIPGYHPEGMYEFKVDLNGDAVEEISYRFTFDARDAQEMQRYTVRSIRGPEAVDPHAAGTVIVQGTTDENVTGGDPVCGFGPAKRVTRSGLSPPYCMR